MRGSHKHVADYIKQLARIESELAAVKRHMDVLCNIKLEELIRVTSQLPTI